MFEFEGHVQVGEAVRQCNLYYKVRRPESGAAEEEQVKPDMPTIVIVHGGPGLDYTIHYAYWHHLADLYGYQVVFFDQRGQGRSDHRVPAEWNLWQWAEDLHSLCDRLEIVNPIIIGISTGGHVAMQYAILYPEHPGGLILCDTEARQPLEEILDAYEVKGGTVAREVARLVFTDTCEKTLAEYQRLCLPLSQNHPVVQESFFDCQLTLDVTKHYNQQEHFFFNFMEDLHLVNKCKILIIAGDVSAMHREISARRMAEVFPEELVTLRVFSGAGTQVCDHVPDAVDAVIGEFVSEALSFKEADQPVKSLL